MWVDVYYGSVREVKLILTWSGCADDQQDLSSFLGRLPCTLLSALGSGRQRAVRTTLFMGVEASARTASVYLTIKLLTTS